MQDTPAIWMVSPMAGSGAPVSTRELSRAMGRNGPTSIRPRVTELCQMGLAECVGCRDGEGLYRAIPLAEARASHEARASGRAEQRLLPLEA